MWRLAVDNDVVVTVGVGAYPKDNVDAFDTFANTVTTQRDSYTPEQVCGVCHVWACRCATPYLQAPRNKKKPCVARLAVRTHATSRRPMLPLLHACARTVATPALCLRVAQSCDHGR